MSKNSKIFYWSNFDLQTWRIHFHQILQLIDFLDILKPLYKHDHASKLGPKIIDKIRRVDDFYLLPTVNFWFQARSFYYIYFFIFCLLPLTKENLINYPDL